MANTNIEFELTNGPAKFELMNSLMTGKTVRLTFTHEGVSAEYTVEMTALRRMDADGNLWVFQAKGFNLIFPNAGPLSTLGRFREISSIHQESFCIDGGLPFPLSGQYNLATRKGRIIPGHDFTYKPQIILTKR